MVWLCACVWLGVHAGIDVKDDVPQFELDRKSSCEALERDQLVLMVIAVAAMALIFGILSSDGHTVTK